MDISAKELQERLEAQKDLNIIDVRDRIEFHTFNIGGKHIPLGQLVNSLDDLDVDKDEEVILICAHGVRSKTAVQILQQSGFTNVRNLKGGILSYRKLNQ